MKDLRSSLQSHLRISFSEFPLLLDLAGGERSSVPVVDQPFLEEDARDDARRRHLGVVGKCTTPTEPTLLVKTYCRELRIAGFQAQEIEHGSACLRFEPRAPSRTYMRFTSAKSSNSATPPQPTATPSILTTKKRICG